MMQDALLQLYIKAFVLGFYKQATSKYMQYAIPNMQYYND